ncbi:transcriptional regulator [Pseudothermotoga hypogea DSM 11164 = NBRC 106472]|uniref:Transcriptional regulator n=2 Tax=Pseudothermotoga hypogea TaxID=57487 RepID=A0A0X1KS30_9THEM|nr:response regulator transcription factor [Pseudothermotoga hypogea]AJC74063.1 transcriptional regulator [Pseudothermotoga hypogea DSM 11164 = NBRC 106472]MBC7122267.1 response regulator transcription factor [Pseudothermotoga sp.]
MRILVVEDNEDLANSIKRGLEKEGYSVQLAFDGDTGLDMALEGNYDCIVLDVLLPGVDGFEFVQTLRETNVQTPVLMLTALDSVDDKVTGLSSGADDYLTKPFDFRELLARVQSLIRRSHLLRGEVLSFKDIQLNSRTRKVTVKGAELKLSRREFDLLELFMRDPNVVFSREEILERVWGNERETKSNVVDVYVLYLRSKLKPFGYDKFLESVPGIGYRLRTEA